MATKKLTRTPSLAKTAGLQLLRTIAGTGTWVSRIEFSPDGSKLAVASQRGHVRVHDVGTGELLFEMQIPVYHVYSARWSPDGRVIASTHDDCFIRFWDGTTGELMKTVDVRSKDECNARQERWKEENEGVPVERATNRDTVRALDWSPNGEQFATGEESGLSLWNWRSCERILSLRDAGDVINIRWSPDGSRVATTSYGNSLCIYNIGDESMAHRLPITYTDGLAWSPDGSRIVSAQGRDVCVWDAASGKLANVLEGHTARPRALAFSQDGAFLASRAGLSGTTTRKGVEDQRLLIWRTDTWTVCGIVRETQGWYLYTGLSFSPKAPLLASCALADKRVRLWSFDRARLYRAKPLIKSVYYKNAKVALVGDTSVGKSGLHLVLTGHPFVATESTHARQISVLSSRKVRLSDATNEFREIVLWDLAGQPGYRLIHQLHLEDVTVAVIVFDSRNESDPFSGVRHWNRVLLHCSQFGLSSSPAPVRLLVAARIDRGTIAVSAARIGALLLDLGISSVCRDERQRGNRNATTAEGDTGVDQLGSPPPVTSNILFQEIPPVPDRLRLVA